MIRTVFFLSTCALAAAAPFTAPIALGERRQLRTAPIRAKGCVVPDVWESAVASIDKSHHGVDEEEVQGKYFFDRELLSWARKEEIRERSDGKPATNNYYTIVADYKRGVEVGLNRKTKACREVKGLTPKVRLLLLLVVLPLPLLPLMPLQLLLLLLTLLPKDFENDSPDAVLEAKHTGDVIIGVLDMGGSVHIPTGVTVSQWVGEYTQEVRDRNGTKEKEEISVNQVRLRLLRVLLHMLLPLLLVLPVLPVLLLLTLLHLLLQNFVQINLEVGEKGYQCLPFTDNRQTNTSAGACAEGEHCPRIYKNTQYTNCVLGNSDPNIWELPCTPAADGSDTVWLAGTAPERQEQREISYAERLTPKF